MAEVLLQQRLAAIGVDAVVTSAGDLPGGVHASPGSVRAMAARGLDLSRHVSRTLSTELLEDADLVIAMARRHARSAVALAPSGFEHTFTLKELVRRGTAVGPRRSGQSFEAWLATLHAGRAARSLLGEDPRDDVADPIGGPAHLYEATAVELTELIDQLVDLAFQSTVKREPA
jgi:protein-tyrosine phosphatase